MGEDNAGTKPQAVAATTTSLPATAEDWNGNRREMKDGWVRRRWGRGGSGREAHLLDTGSYEESPARPESGPVRTA